MPFQKLLVAVDITGCAQEVIDVVTPLAQSLSAEIVLAYVVPTVSGVESAATVVTEEHPEGVLASVAAEEDARDHLETLAGTFRRLGVPTTCRLVRGAPSDAIVSLSEKVQADLIVTGTHGRKGFKRMLMGSVAENILRRSEVPVLTVRTLDDTSHPGLTRTQQQLDAESLG